MNLQKNKRTPEEKREYNKQYAARCRAEHKEYQKHVAAKLENKFAVPSEKDVRNFYFVSLMP